MCFFLICLCLHCEYIENFYAIRIFLDTEIVHDHFGPELRSLLSSDRAWRKSRFSTNKSLCLGNDSSRHVVAMGDKPKVT